MDELAIACRGVDLLPKARSRYLIAWSPPKGGWRMTGSAATALDVALSLLLGKKIWVRFRRGNIVGLKMIRGAGVSLKR